MRSDAVRVILTLLGGMVAMVVLGLSLPLYGEAKKAAVLEVIPNEAQQMHFAADNPCPQNDRVTLRCPGFIIHYAVPLCAGGFDNVMNMEWVHLDVNRLWIEIERSYCACLHTLGRNKCPAINWNEGR